MLGEPAPTQGDLNFKLFDIPVRIHPFFWLVAAMLGASSPDLPALLMWVAAVLISILVHEMGHALVLKAYGFHSWVVLYGLGGITCHNPGENYRSKGNSPFGQIAISFAGPGAGFLLAGALVAVLFLAGFREQILFFQPLHLLPVWVHATRGAQFINYIFFVSVFWGLVNLLPIYPLDGGQIVREFLLYVSPQGGIRQSLVLSTLAAVVVAIFAFVQWHEWFIGLFFGFLAYE
ncbi:MAG: metalloprotease, partial [Thermoguttaceae bacterium]